MVEVDLFDTVILKFQGALDSDGIGNEIIDLVVEQKDTNGVSVRNHTATQDISNSQIFSFALLVSRGDLTGTYSACKLLAHIEYDLIQLVYCYRYSSTSHYPGYSQSHSNM